MWRTVDEEQLLAWGQQAGCILQKHGALRIGESSVASFHVHTIEPTKPGFVNILLGSDAGEVFYQRSMPGEIIHLDIFHSLGKVDHRKVAAGIKAFASVKLPETFARYPLLDYMDLQTGTGGGRVSGSLIFGMKESLQKAHMNHVHITVKIPHDLMGLLVPLVAIVEDEIMAHGYEVRRIEGLNFLRGRNKQPVDLSHYATQSDSFMQNQNQTVSLRSSEEQEQLETALDLAQKVMNPAELKDIFADFVAGRGQAPHAYAEEQQAMLKRMQELNLIRVRGGRYYLTSKGLKLKEFLGNHFAEVEFYFRKLLRKVPIGSKRSKDNHGSINLRGCAQGGKQKR
jgi:magnesium chelatase subunit D